MQPRTLLDRLWDSHLVRPQTIDTPALLYIDLHLLNEVTSPQAFTLIEERNLCVRNPERTLATIDHSTPTLPPSSGGRRKYVSPAAESQVAALERNARKWGIPFFGWNDPRRGIVHVIGPELGVTLPGTTIVCGDSHTSTHGAFGALAFGIGTSEVGGVLATQCLPQRKPKALHVRVDGGLNSHATAKDLALAIVTRLEADGGRGHVIEYGGEAIRALLMEGRMTVCNMAIEAGARAGLIAPDETTFAWLAGRPYAPHGDRFARAVEQWLNLKSDADAVFDKHVVIDAASIAPSVTWGITPDTAMPVDGLVPPPNNADAERVLRYMGFTPGQPIAGAKVDVVFIGSCTNGRIPDLRAAAAVLKGRRIAPGVRLLVVPGSELVRRAAEAEGLDQIFTSAGAEWRLSGCSMCLGMNGDITPSGQLVVSTSNRNFIGRQGTGARSVLASPATAAASAVAGAIADPRRLVETGHA